MGQIANQMDKNSLYKNVIFLGSSVTYGFASDGVSFADFLQEKYGFNMIKEAVSGTTLADKDDQSYVSRLKTIDANECDLFVCQLSTNDANLDLPLKDIEDAIDYIIDYVKKKWNCQIAFYTNPKYESAQYDAMVELMKKKENEEQIVLLNMWDDEEINQKKNKIMTIIWQIPYIQQKKAIMRYLHRFWRSYGKIIILVLRANGLCRGGEAFTGGDFFDRCTIRRYYWLNKRIT